MSAETVKPTYHVLLIGIDRYPPGYRGLRGCVNDIDAIESLLLEPPGVGFPAEQIRITRLAAPLAKAVSTSRFQGATMAPTKANLIQALKNLAGPEVQPADRVLIYYSGHGDERQWRGTRVWHEALVPHDDEVIELLFDVEINLLTSAIAARTKDLTIILDCCHSAGATRALTEVPTKGGIRALMSEPAPVPPPDLGALSLGGSAAQDTGAGLPLLQAPEPSYLAVVACQSDEKAGEGAYPEDQPAHGVLTHSLLSVLAAKGGEERAGLRWGDIWPNLVEKAAERNTNLWQRLQHPWLIGRSERKIFGGPWEPMDIGYRVTRKSDGSYEVGAGTLMGVTEGAEMAVYGPEPRFFPAIGSPTDQPVGRLSVSQARPANAVATAVGGAFTLPDGARGRLVKPGKSQALQVRLMVTGAGLEAALRKSALLEMVPPGEANFEVEVLDQPGGGWIIGNDTEPILATVPAGEVEALRAGLEHYYRYNTVLRLARNCHDPQISHSLSVEILDCNDTAALKAMSAKELADPSLPAAPRDQDRIYCLQPGFRFCVRVTNSSRYHLNVTLLNCSAGGTVEYLSDALLREKAADVMWYQNQLGKSFKAKPDTLPAGVPGISRPDYSTERLIAIGTTRADVSLESLKLEKGVQQVVDDNLSRLRGMKSLGGDETETAPAELWTATVTPIRIVRQ